MDIQLTLRARDGTVSEGINIIAGGDPAWAELEIPNDEFETRVELRSRYTVLTIRPR
jgi:hypothetical protein